MTKFCQTKPNVRYKIFLDGLVIHSTHSKVNADKTFWSLFHSYSQDNSNCIYLALYDEVTKKYHYRTQSDPKSQKPKPTWGQTIMDAQKLQTEVEKAIAARIVSAKEFTAHDITKDVRRANLVEDVQHDAVKDLVVKAYQNKEMGPNITRESRNFGTGNAWVYLVTPATTSPTKPASDDVDAAVQQLMNS